MWWYNELLNIVSPMVIIEIEATVEYDLRVTFSAF